MRGLKRGLTRLTAVLSVSAVVLVGCASPRATYITADDSCSSIREPFVQIKERQQQQIQEWAMAGAAAGAVAGGAIGGATQGDLAGVLIGTLGGALVGGFAGAAMGYHANLQERGLETAALRNAVYDDAASDARTGDRLVQAVADLNACRLQAIEDVATDFKAGTLSREAAQAELNRIKTLAAMDNELVDSVLEGLEKRSDIYVNAMKKSGAQDADAYLSKVESYTPSIEPAVYTVGRPIETRTVRARSNVRAGAGTGFDVVKTLDAGSMVEVLNDNGGWSEVDFGTGRGYISNTLFGPVPEAPAVTPEPAKKPEIKGVSVAAASRPKTDNAIEELAVTRTELSAVKKAHVASVNRSVADTEALLFG